MAGAVALDDVETSEASPEVSVETPEINAEQEATTDESIETVEKANESVEEAKEEVEIPTAEEIVVGDKKYTKEQAVNLLDKIGRYQGDRDRAEAALEKIAKQISQHGFEVGPDLSIRKKEATPQVNKAELAEKAVLGDTQALQQLLAVQSQEVAQNITSNLKEEKALDNIYKEVTDNYPDFYVKGEDGKVVRNNAGAPIANPDSPLFKEALAIIEKYPGLTNPYALPILADMAEARLLRKNLPKMEQLAKDKALQRNKTGKILTTVNGTPNVRTEVTPLPAEVSNAAVKFGSTPDRISKIVERAQKTGGYYL